MIIRFRNTFLFVSVIFMASLVTGCSSGDDVPTATNQQNNNNSGNPGNGGSGGSGGGTIDDPDGDGVDSSVEIGENTDPQDPCSYILTSQDYTITTQEWRNLDCDGDGVTNGDEVDPDGNDQNDGNGTDPQELCSFDISNQTVEPSSQWNSTDCDNDCQNNALEKRFGTDPLNPEDYIDFEGRISSASYTNSHYYLENNGQRLDRSFFEPWYDNNFYYQDDKLSETIFTDSDAGFVIHKFNYYYDGDILDRILYLDAYDITLEYNGYTITADHLFAPAAHVATLLELDPVSGRVLRQEKFSGDYDERFGFTVSEFHYDENMENLLQLDIEEYLYDSTTDEFTFSTSYTENFTYHSDILNPFFESYSLIELHSRLSRWEDYTGGAFGMLSSFLPLDAAFSKNLLASHTTNLGTTTYEPNACAGVNNYPFQLTINSGSNSQVVNYYYSQ